MRAAALNRIVEINPDNTGGDEQEAKREQPPKPNFLFDSNGKPFGRKIRFEDRDYLDDPPVSFTR
jgi:hypothetical protein